MKKKMIIDEAGLLSRGFNILNKIEKINKTINYNELNNNLKNKLLLIKEQAKKGNEKAQQFLERLKYKSLNRLNILTHMSQLSIIVDNALEGNIRAINFLTKRKIIEYPEKYYDDYGNHFIAKGILENQLNYHWRRFDDTHHKEMTPQVYIKELNNFLNKNCGIKTAQILLLNN